MKILHLTLKRKWFDLIASGKKKIEYRATTEYWKNRLTKPPVESRLPVLFIKQFDEVWFRNGYNPKNPFMRIEWKGLDLKEFEGRLCWAIILGKVLEIKNYQKR